MALALSLQPSISPPRVQSWQAGGVYHIAGILSVQATLEQAWGVLTDFDRLSTFVPSVRRSTVERVTPRGVLLRQVLEGKFMFFSRDVTVLLCVVEQPYRSLSFRDVSGADFDLYRGVWRLIGGGGATTLVYHLQAKPRLRMPAAIGASAMKDEVTELLADVGREIDRRRAIPQRSKVP
jgi:carbon monoxide dehydrogenase subunit G